VSYRRVRDEGWPRLSSLSKRGKAASVLEGLRSLEGVIDAQMVTGPYDVIARVRLADLHDLDVLLSARVRPLDGVLRVLASPVVPSRGLSRDAEDARRTHLQQCPECRGSGARSVSGW
jgi:DNA-binding Lrp family transcriptional regulator